jgi:pSer/pThr/pTyr-binding forkhead associated (FHA) protein/predicted Ser/Thr protein kinase
MAGNQLWVTEGNERGKRLSVDADLLIGRLAPEEDGRLGDDPEISRRHARVSRGTDGLLSIEDLGSANGTFVNDERIDAPRTLDLGDVIRVGKTVLRVTDRSGAVPEKPRGAPAGGPATATAEAGEELVVTAGTAPGRRLALKDELVIGRGVSGEGRLSDDHELSRRHARVARDASGELTIEDLGSANGTFVNGERVSGRHVLKVGDSVEVGSTTLQLTDGERVPVIPAPAASAPAPPPAAPAPAAPAASAAPPAAPPAARVRRPPPPNTPPAPLRRPPAPPRRPSAPPRRPAAPATPAADRGGLASELPLHSVFAGCRVEDVISHGDMGVVYRAEELALQRRVALKLILPEYSRDERFRERFRRESTIAAAIDHPNVIPIFDAGDEDGVLYITMRLVEGTDLGALIAADGRIEPLRAARIVRQVGAALDAAHARGMLHRDVKPPNVLLARDDHVYLSDFGLAKRAASGGELTRQGSIVARAEYVAPEQILNDRIDARADVYALGCLLFEALTGEAPFARWEEGPGALAHLDAPRPSPVQLCPDLPREFDDVVRRAMAIDPSERYPSAGDLGQAALVAAGGLRRASPWSVVATGAAAPSTGDQPAEAFAAAPRAPAPERAEAGRADALRWAIALAALVLVAAGMVAALSGISSLS